MPITVVTVQRYTEADPSAMSVRSSAISARSSPRSSAISPRSSARMASISLRIMCTSGLVATSAQPEGRDQPPHATMAT